MTVNPFSDDSTSPYRPPSSERVLPVYARRPGALTAVCVLAIIMGFLALGSAFGTALSVIINLLGGVGGMFSSGMNTEMERIQQEMYEEMTAMSNQYVVIHIVIILGLLAMGIALLVGGFRTLKLVEAGRQTLVAACSAAVLFEILRCVWLSYEQMQVMGIMRTHLGGPSNAMPGGGQMQAMQGLMSISMYAGIAFALGWAAMKLGFYIFATIYLRRDGVRQLFDAGAKP